MLLLLVTLYVAGLTSSITVITILSLINTILFFEKKIYFHKTNLQHNHTCNTKRTIYKKKEIKAKKRLEILKERRKRNGVSHYVIQTIERRNSFKLFSLYTFYAID